MSGPCRKRLEAQSPEAQRILNVLDESILKMRVISCLPDGLERSEQVTPIPGDHTAALLAEHLQLSEDQDVQSVQSLLQDFLRAIQGSGLLGSVLQGSGPVSEEDRGAMWKLNEGLQSFRDMMLDRLLTTPAEENILKRRAQEATMRHRSDLKLIDKLEKEVGQAEQERDEELGRRDEEILKRRNALHKVVQEKKENLLKTQMDSFQQKVSDQKNSVEKRQRLKLQVDQLEILLTTQRSKHWESAQTLLTKNKKLEMQIDGLIKRYDSDLGEKQKELERLTRMYEEERAELKELQELHAVLEPEYTQILEERCRAEERRNQEEKELQAKSRAALIIQATWRGWRVRKVLRKTNKNKKSKNKKGKGGKRGK